MAKAQVRRNGQYEILPTRDYNLVIHDVMQFEGPRGPYVRITFRELVSGKLIYGNFSLGTEVDDAGVWAIQELAAAVNACPTNTAFDLDDHDFEDAGRNDTLLDSVVIGRVYSEEFPEGSNRWRNKVGRIQAALPQDPGAVTPAKVAETV